jgi:hypothetical protein
MIMKQAGLAEACDTHLNLLRDCMMCDLTFMMLPNLYPGILPSQLWRLFVAWTPELQVWQTTSLHSSAQLFRSGEFI